MSSKEWQGLNITITWDEAHYLATCDEFLTCGTGSTEEEAFQDFKISLFELKDDLIFDSQLSDQWKLTRDRLNKIHRD